MCSIFILPAGVNIPEEKLFRAVANNPHGFGIIVRDTVMNRVQVFREIEEETDYLKVKKILDDNIDLDRYVHLRWATVGEKNLDNVHPFTSYWTEGRQVYMMHNGTLQDFNTATNTYVNGASVPNEFKGWSDSRRFNHEIIMPLMLQVDAGDGKGDIKNPFTLKTISKFWNSYNSKGILISSDQGHELINPSGWRWVDFEQEDGTVVRVRSANDDYYDTITRGPEYERRRAASEKERLEREAAERASRTPSGDSETNVSKQVTIRSDTFAKRHGVIDQIDGIGHFVIKDDPESLALLAYLTHYEVEDLVQKRPDEMASIFISVTNSLNEALISGAKREVSMTHLNEKVKILRKALNEAGVDYKEVEKAA